MHSGPIDQAGGDNLDDDFVPRLYSLQVINQSDGEDEERGSEQVRQETPGCPNYLDELRPDSECRQATQKTRHHDRYTADARLCTGRRPAKSVSKDWRQKQREQGCCRAQQSETVHWHA